MPLGLDASSLLCAGNIYIYAKVALTAIALWLLHAFFTSNKFPVDVSKKDWAPQVAGGVPILGHALEYSKSTFDFIEKYRKVHGRCFMARIAFKNIVFLDGTFAKAFFSAPESVLSFTDAMAQMLVPDLTIGLHVLHEPWHMPLMRVTLRAENVSSTFSLNLEPLYKRAVCRHLPGGAVRGDTSTTLLKSTPLCWDLVAHFSSLSFFGPFMFERHYEPLLKVFKELHVSCFQVINTCAVMPQFAAFFAARELHKHKERVRDMVSEEVRRRRSLPPNSPKSQTCEDDLLTTMMSARKKDGSENPDLLSDVVVADYMISLIFASMSTTAGVLTNVFYELAGRPEYQSSLRLEGATALKICGGKIANVGGVAFLDRLPLMTSFIREAVRLASLPIQGVRVAREECVLNGVRIPKGSVVTNCGILAHYDETAYADPFEFKASRFDGVDVETSDKFNPFGIGRHVCPGRHFAMAEIKVSLTLLLQEWSFSTVSGKVPKYAFLPTETLRVDEPVVFTKL